MVAKSEHGVMVKSVQTLFNLGAIGGISDGELLGSFAAGHSERAELAFTALVERHGPMVLRVCRSILRDEHDAQDAFQATFLVLVRRAGVIRKRESVGSWLHGVAVRVSTCARTSAARRQRHERSAAAGATVYSPDESDSREIAAVLHEELGRLPARYREAVVLCHLEGLSCEVAAQRLGWPVGTVKSRLSRARERLLHRLIRRGIGPEAGTARHAMISPVPTLLVSETVLAMLRFAAGGPAYGLISATAVSWAVGAVRSMQMNRIVLLGAALFFGLSAVGAAVLATQKPNPGRPLEVARPAVRDRERKLAPVVAGKADPTTVRVVDSLGKGIPNVAVRAFESVFNSEIREYRTGADGRCQAFINARAPGTRLHARAVDGSVGWARIDRGGQYSEGMNQRPVEIVLLPKNHHVEGSIKNIAGKPIGGVRVRVIQFQHETNGSATEYRGDREEAFLGSAVTDESGRFTMFLPEGTHAILAARHPSYFGPLVPCSAGDPTIAPVILEDAGGIVGTVIDAITGEPAENARVGVGIIEHGALRPVRYGLAQGGEGGEATTDVRGRFKIRGLAPGVFNVVLLDSGRGRKFTARAVEGVRLRAGDDAQADLVMIEGRRLHGEVLDFADEKPMADISVSSYNPARPRSGNTELMTTTDDSGHFELFVPPGSSDVYCRGHYQHRTVVADRDPDPIFFRKARGPTADYYEKSPVFIELVARIRISADAGDGAPRKERELTGRVFDQHGLPIAGVRVSYNREKLVQGATDRMGWFRLRGLPVRSFELAVVKNGYTPGSATIPADAHEIELTLPTPPD
jgi:RNA polymerase sigma factor (sigma-70 family)